MSLQVLLKNVGGTIETYFLAGQPGTTTVTLYNDAGSAKVSAATCTVDSVATTASSAVASRATTVALTSATGVVSGRRYALGVVDGTETREVVTVKSLSGSTATLMAPTVAAHVSGAAFKGLRVSYAVASTACDAIWWGGHADFVPASGDTITEDIDCCKHKIPDYLCDETDLRDIFPKLAKIIDSEQDIQRSLRNARDRFLVDFGGKFRAHSALGAGEYRQAVAMRWWLDRRYALGDDWSEQMDRLATDYATLRDHLRSQVAFDVDGDERTDGVEDAGWTVATLERA